MCFHEDDDQNSFCFQERSVAPIQRTKNHHDQTFSPKCQAHINTVLLLGLATLFFPTPINNDVPPDNHKKFMNASKPYQGMLQELSHRLISKLFVSESYGIISTEKSRTTEFRRNSQQFHFIEKTPKIRKIKKFKMS